MRVFLKKKEREREYFLLGDRDKKIFGELPFHTARAVIEVIRGK